MGDKFHNLAANEAEINNTLGRNSQGTKHHTKLTQVGITKAREVGEVKLN